MKVFVYRGFDQTGSRRKGTIEAGDLKEAREKLLRDGVLAELLQPAGGAGAGRLSGVMLARNKYRSGFYRALSALLRAGLTMSSALEVLNEEPGSGEISASLDIMSIRERIREGSSFSSSVSSVCPTLGPFESAVLESGEKSGRLGEVLIDLSDYLDDMERTRDLLKTASIYPCIVVLVALVVAAGVLGFMVPHFAGVLEQLGGELPVITRLVMALGEWFFPVIMPVFTLLAGFAWFRWRAIHRDDARRISFEQKISKWPVLSTGFMLLVTVRFARTCHLLLAGGISMVEAVSLAGRATGSRWLAAAAAEQAELIRHGKSLSQAIGEIPLVNRTLGMWVKAGEAAGDLPSMFLHASSRYRQLWSQFVQRITMFIEPALVVIVALFVLAIALAIVLPVLTMSPEIL